MRTLPLAILLGLLGCQQTEPKQPLAEPPPTPDAIAPIVRVDAASPGGSAAAIAPRGLKPRFFPIATRGIVPTELVIELDRDIVNDADDTPAETPLRFEPDTPGALIFDGRSRLRFTPTQGFLPGTTYTARLEAVGTSWGVEKPPTPWTTRFTTPAFGFLRIDAVSRSKERVKATLVFSAPVDPSTLTDLASWTVDGVAPQTATYTRGPRPHLAVATLTTTGPVAAKPGALVRLFLKAGLAMASHPEHTAGAAEAVMALPDKPAVSIEHISRRESPSGHYVEVICNDEASEGPERHYWDSEEYENYWVSARCLPSAASLKEHIHFEPPVKKLQVSSSRAGFRLTGDFQRGRYALQIDTGMQTVDGGALRASQAANLFFPPRKASLSIVSRGRYLPRKAWRSLAVRHLNVGGQLSVQVRHVPRRNLVFWMSGAEPMASRTSDLVIDTRVAVKGTTDESRTSWIDLSALVPEPKPGIYEVRVSARGQRAAARLLLTDLNLVAKRSAPPPGSTWSREIFVWAIDMRTAVPRPNVLVQALVPSGRALAECTTRPDGGCQLVIPPKGPDPEPPFALIATQGTDLTYLKFAELETEVGSAKVQGVPYQAERAYRAAIYSDRGVYRPGERAHLVAILRGRDDRAPPAGLPVEWHLVDPRQQLARRVTLQSNAAGMVALDHPLEDFAATGRWSAQLLVGKKPVGTYTFKVEEFVPERMEVTAQATRPGYLDRDEASIEVHAKYLFGGSAEGSPVTLSCRLDPGPFLPKQNKDFTFGAAEFDGKPFKTLDLGETTGELGPGGITTIECPTLDDAAGFASAGKLVATVGVEEAGSGRVTQTETRAPVHPERFYLGLRTRAKKATPGEVIRVEGVVVDWEGALLPETLEAEVEVVRMVAEHQWYYDYDEGEESQERDLRPITQIMQKVPIRQGRFELSFTPEESSAALLVRARAARAFTELRIEGESDAYAWDWRPAAGTDVTPRPGKPVPLQVLLPGGEIEVGKPTTVIVKAPFKGRALLTAETDRVLRAQWREVTPGENRWTLTFDRFYPNVYLSALLVKDPYLDSPKRFLPDRAFGVTSARMKPTTYVRTVKLDLPDEIRPNSPLKIGLDLGPSDEPTFVTVAAVDEGILSLTRFPSPDPLAKILERRALGVASFETVGWAMRMSPAGPSSSTGGDDDAGPGRLMPVRPVALWSGIREVPKSGKLEISLDVPTYRGALRVMVVSAGPTRIGHASGSVKVRDPLVLLATLPRFLTAGDDIQIPVFVTNMSGAERDVVVALEARDEPIGGLTAADPSLSPAPPIRLVGPSKKTLHLKPEEAGTVVFAARALRQVGGATFRISATAKIGGGELVSWDEATVPFLPAGPRTRTVQRVELEQGRLDLKPYLKGWVPTSEQSTFWVTNVPYAAALSHLSHLVRYPHGCIEQTTSSTRPLLFVADLVGQIDPSLARRGGGIEQMVMHGVRRVLSMQTPAGGFAYWPGGRAPHAWGTAYASHMLLDAQERGYPIPASRLKDALDWLEGAVGGDLKHYKHAEAYMHYVLARAGRGRKARMAQLLAQLPDGPPPKKRWPTKGELAEQRYLLQAGLFLAGDRRHQAALKRLDLSTLRSSRRSGGSFYSDRRRRGLILSTFHDLFGADPAGEPLAAIVARGLAGASTSYSTQELVWGVTGLGKWIEGQKARFDPPVLRANGEPVAPQQSAGQQKAKKPRSDRTWGLARASEYGRLELQVQKKSEGKLYLVISSQGVQAIGKVEEGGEGLSVDRSWLDPQGKELKLDDPRAVGLGDVIYTRIVLENTTDERVDNIALVDRFPAGWEIENPRLGRGQRRDWMKEEAAWSASYMNLRDDRLEMFGSLEAGQSVEVIYALRAVTAGTFLAPPVEAEAMYDPTLWAREAGRLIRVDGPWAEYLD